ncbi:type IV pilin [Methanonatronarchaeum sp. AMET-Sl]|uniref:type IV pilin n=1 Tax=Methanonatronarchaeum sp. AMET-Sl TaxID=3037654 RepID=UPI00244DC87E|nr:type IV pilin [Methanonatronarchaeum sp. AMET-Sl]WGI17679.1 type IV pilin [Methanonatronarchaeum sp. AMET-Sl]
MVGFFGGERGVSPVIGVILMVGIVVVLAGMVSTFVFVELSLEREPLAEISIEEPNVQVNEDGEVELVSVSLFHRMGSPIDSEDVHTSVTVYDSEQNSYAEQFDLSEWLDGEESWTAGQEINKIFDLDDLEQYFGEIQGDIVEVEVWIIHTPTGNTIQALNSDVSEEVVYDQPDFEVEITSFSEDPLTAGDSLDVTVTVYDEDGDRVADQDLTDFKIISGTQDEEVYTENIVQLNEDGEYTAEIDEDIITLADDEHTITADADEVTQASDSLTVEPADVAEIETPDLVLEPETTGDITVTVTDEFGNLVDDETVTVDSVEEGLEGISETDELDTEDGAATFEDIYSDDEGEYTIEFSAEDPDIQNTSTITVEPANVDSIEADDVTITAGENGEITVTAYYEGEPIEGIEISVEEDDGLNGIETGDTETTDTEGIATFTFNEETADEYTIEFSAEDADGNEITDTSTVTVEEAEEDPYDIIIKEDDEDGDEIEETDRVEKIWANTNNVTLNLEYTGDQDPDYDIESNENTVITIDPSMDITEINRDDGKVTIEIERDHQNKSYNGEIVFGQPN